MSEKHHAKPPARATSLPLPAPLLHGVKAYANGANIGPACWEHDDLIIVTHGSVEFRVGEDVYLCEAGDALVIPPRHRFVGAPQPNGCTIWVQHLRYRSEKERERAGLGGSPLHCRAGVGSAWTRVLMQRIRSLQLARGADAAADPELPLLLGLLLASVQAVNEPAPSFDSPTIARVKRVVSWARSHPEPMPSAEVLAARAELSVSQFRAVFQRAMGMGLGRFLRDLRLEEGARLLGESNMPIKQIARRIGYGDPVAFHRAFLHKTGETPARYRAGAPEIL